jgi:hypothetical protein
MEYLVRRERRLVDGHGLGFEMKCKSTKFDDDKEWGWIGVGERVVK